MLKHFFSGPLHGPRSFFAFWRLLDARAWFLFFLYLLLAGSVVGLFALLAVSIGPELKQGFLEYVFPDHWRMAGRMLLDKLLGRLGPKVVANFIINGGMATISLFCFALKEILSRRIEHQNKLVDEAHAPWPLWRQAIEESKFAVLYLVAYNLIFWIGYPPQEWLRWLALGLSYLTLFIFFNITFMCPLLLRHRIGYGRMVRTFFARPLAAFGFAGWFLAPALIATHLMEGQDWSTVAAVLLGIHVLTVPMAASAGTWLAARLLPTAKALRPTHAISRVLGVGGMIAIMIVSSVVFARLADSAHAKSQILKCQYRVDWSSLDYELPSFSDLSLGLSFDVEITNPTEVDVRIEDSRLEIQNDHRYFATANMGQIQVAAGQARRQKVEIRLQVAISRLLEFRSLMDKPWDFILWVSMDKDWEFPIYFK